MNNKQWLIIFLLLLSPLLSAQAKTEVEKKVDSLFVIASSGDIQYRDLVAPAIEELAEMGTEIVPQLIEMLDTKSARERLTIINIIKKISSPAVPMLLEALDNSDGLIVQRVCGVLGDIKDSTAVLPLIEISNHPRWQVREQAIGSLGDIRDSQASTTVMTALEDSIGQVRKAASVACGKIIEGIKLKLLVNRFGDEFYGARMSAYEALLKFDLTAVTAVLSDSINSDNQLTAALCCQALGTIGNESAIAVLYETAQALDVYLRAQAAVALINADPLDKFGYHESLLNNEVDRLSILKIKSAIEDAQNAAEEIN